MSPAPAGLATVWLFSGQGSQYFRMGRELYQGEAVFRRTLETCSEILQPRLGLDLAEEIYRERADRHAPFERTRHSGPAIIAVQLGVARLLRARGQQPELLLGYSLGEVTAAIVAGALSVEDGLELAVRMAELLEQDAPPGGMVAILADAALAAERPAWFADTWIAARNFPGHFVVSGGLEALERLERRLGEAEIAFQRLPVEFAFHSPLIEPTAEATLALLRALPRPEGTVEMVSATDGRRFRRLDPEALWRTFAGPVDFRPALAALDAGGPWRYVDVGPSGTLATFVRYALPAGSGSEVAMTVTPFGTAVQNLERLFGRR